MDPKLLARNLRKPEGEFGRQVGEQMNKGNRIIYFFTLDRLKPSQNDHVLELGMGNGYFCKDVLTLNSGLKYTGADFSEDMVEEAIKLNKEFIVAGNADFVLAHAEKLPFQDNTFNSIFTINTIYFWEDPAIVLNEFKRVLKPGGKLVIAIRSKSFMKNLPFTQYGFRLYENDEIREMLVKGRFSHVSYEEISEPEQEFNGRKVIMESVIFQGQKAY